VEGGYADQSHLHRDVVAFTGMTPATVAGEPWLAVDDIAWTAGRRLGSIRSRATADGQLLRGSGRAVARVHLGAQP
jgi:hypothetical protein